MRGAPLFGESLQAWDHGPVVEQLYHEYKKYGRDPIPVVTDFDESKIDEPDRIALNDIFDHFNQFSAWRLRGMTHEEPPWADAYKRVQGSEISIDAMVDSANRGRLCEACLWRASSKRGASLSRPS
jgi:uncharacterized phage-associated protein